MNEINLKNLTNPEYCRNSRNFLIPFRNIGSIKSIIIFFQSIQFIFYVCEVGMLFLVFVDSLNTRPNCTKRNSLLKTIIKS